jgi:hypothetical protein
VATSLIFSLGALGNMMKPASWVKTRCSACDSSWAPTTSRPWRRYAAVTS